MDFCCMSPLHLFRSHIVVTQLYINRMHCPVVLTVLHFFSAKGSLPATRGHQQTRTVFF